jgi:hypothetical protein
MKSEATALIRRYRLKPFVLALWLICLGCFPQLARADNYYITSLAQVKIGSVRES